MYSLCQLNTHFVTFWGRLLPLVVQINFPLAPGTLHKTLQHLPHCQSTVTMLQRTKTSSTSEWEVVQTWCCTARRTVSIPHFSFFKCIFPRALYFLQRHKLVLTTIKLHDFQKRNNVVMRLQVFMQVSVHTIVGWLVTTYFCRWTPTFWTIDHAVILSKVKL